MRIPQKRSFRSKNTLVGLIFLLAFAALPSVASDLKTTTTKYLLCVDIKSKNVTHSSTASCPKTSKKLLVNAKGTQGPIGLTGAVGLNGRDGSDGKTLWNGTTDPLDSWGAAGDIYINTTTSYLFGPKNLDNKWTIGISLVGPTGPQGIQGLTGFPGANGLNGGSGSTGETGATGPQGIQGLTGFPGANGLNGGSGSTGATGATGSQGVKGDTGLTGATGSQGVKGDTGLTGAQGSAGDSGSSTSCALGGKCQIGSTGPGGGVVFYYSEAGFTMTGAPCGSSCHYLESANMNWNGNNDLYWRDGVEKLWSKTGDAFQLSVATGRNVGTGFANTEAIIAQQGACETMASCTYIAGYIRLYKGGGKTDWFLPSLREFQLAILNASDQFLGAGLTWWTSTQDPADEKKAWYVWTGAPFDASSSLKIGFTGAGRPVRAF